MTLEEQFARQQNSFAPYWRLDHPVCRRFLACAVSDLSTFESHKALFPFFRDGSIFGVPAERGYFHVWNSVAFFAGWRFGMEHPSEASEAVESVDGVVAGLQRLGTLKKALSGDPPTPRNVLKASSGLARYWHLCPDEQVVKIIVDQCIGWLRAGIVAATRAQIDSDLADFASRIACQNADPSKDLYVRAWVRSVADSYGRAVSEQLRHPVFRVAAEYYVDRPVQWRAMSAALEYVLGELLIQSEVYCPACYPELISLVKVAFKRGRLMSRRRNGLVDAIRDEAGPEEWRNAGRQTFEVAQLAGSLQPAALAGAIHLWDYQNYGAGDGFYGSRLERFIRWFDMAIWLGWLTPLRS